MGRIGGVVMGTTDTLVRGVEFVFIEKLNDGLAVQNTNIFADVFEGNTIVMFISTQTHVTKRVLYTKEAIEAFIASLQM